MPLAPPHPPLADDAISLRGWREDDAPAITAMFQDPQALRWTRAPSPYRERDAQQWLASLPALMRGGGALPLAVVAADDGRLLASLDLRMRGEARGEFGYVVAAAERRRGVGTRALRLYSRWAFDSLRVARIELLVQPDNEASLALARRAGFTRDGLLRSHSLIRGERRDMVMLSLLPTDVAALALEESRPGGRL